MMYLCQATHAGSKSPASTEENNKKNIQQAECDKQRKRFECPVCYEYMEDPFGWGNVCRSQLCHPYQFTLQSVVSVENLWEEIDDHEDIVTFSFWVCGEEL